jgi:cytochrome c biogenesis protein CcdA
MMNAQTIGFVLSIFTVNLSLGTVLATIGDVLPHGQVERMVLLRSY